MKKLFFFIAFFHCIGLISQPMDSLFLNELEIRATSLKNENIGTHVSIINPGIQSNSTLSEIFSAMGFLAIRNNGNNSFSVGSMRGGSSNHTLLLWNGMPINNPMLGLSDLSSIPTGGVTQIKINKGSSSSICGSGSIAGSIHLENLIQNDSLNSISAGLKVASFSNMAPFGSLVFSRKRMQIKLRQDFLQSKNDFPFRITGFDSTFITRNANVKLSNSNFDFTYFHSNFSSFTFHFWNTFANRQIPPNINQKKSEAYQIDFAKRGMLRYKYDKNNLSFSANGGLINESNIYIDKPVKINDTNHFQSYYFDFTAEKYVYEHFKLLLSAFNYYTVANSDNYKEKVCENRTSSLISGYLLLSKIGIQISNRIEKNDDKFQFFIPAIGMESRIMKGLIFKLKVNKNYRYPALNDRYWSNGGNPLLKPEKGWSGEVTLHKFFTLENVRFTFFKRIIHDMILWVPQVNNGIFSPINIAKVNSKGIEISIHNEYQFKDLRLTSDVSYEYVNSINEVGLKIPKIEKGSQLWYVPEHALNINFSVKFKKHGIAYIYNYNSEKNGIQQKLSPFGISAMRLDSEIKLKKNSIQAYFLLENLGNENYNLIENRPMPGINFKLGLQTTINFKKNNL